MYVEEKVFDLYEVKFKGFNTSNYQVVKMDKILNAIYDHLHVSRISELHYKPFKEPIYIHHSRSGETLLP